MRSVSHPSVGRSPEMTAVAKVAKSNEKNTHKFFSRSKKKSLPHVITPLSNVSCPNIISSNCGKCRPLRENGEGVTLWPALINRKRKKNRQRNDSWEKWAAASQLSDWYQTEWQKIKDKTLSHTWLKPGFCDVTQYFKFVSFEIN